MQNSYGKWTKGVFLVLDGDDEVCHVNGSSFQRRNWKKYWLDATGRKWPKCQLYGCGNQAEVGAHVYVKRRHHTFILPTCRRCNSNPLLDYDGDQTIWIPTKLNSIAVWVETHPATRE